jgi:hypothetical protein
MKSFIRLFLLIAPFICLANPPVDDGIIQLIKKSGTAKDYPAANVLVVFDSTITDVQESGLSYVNGHTLVKILTGTGAVNYSVVKFGYDPLSAFVEIKKVRIYRSDGTTEDLDLKKVLDYPAPAGTILWGAREVMLEVGRLETGDAVEIYMFRKGFTYALLQENEDDRYIPPMKGQFYDIVEFWSSEPVKTKVYQVKVPATKNLQYEFYNGDVHSAARFVDNKMVFTFTKKEILPIKTEPNMVSLSDIAPKLLLSTSPDWKAKSRWFYQVNEDFGSFEWNPEIKNKVSEIVKGAASEMDSISRLTHWVADEIRYFGLSMGKGEGYTLHKGCMTFADRCGVCKDKAGMLITMLRAAGFKSYAAMTMAGSKIESIPADYFNHSVTIVQLRDGKFVLLDPTWVPFVRELWSSLEQQQNYLIGTKDGEDLSITPLSAPENHYLKITGTSELLPDGTLIGQLTVLAEGQSDASFRSPLTRSIKSGWDLMMKTELLTDFPTMEIIELKYPDPYDYSKPFELKLKYKIRDYAIVTAKEIIFTPLVASNIFKNRISHLFVNTAPETRKYPFRDRCTRLLELSENIQLPAYSKVIFLPESKRNSGPSAEYNGSYVINSNQLEMKQSVKLNKRIYDPEDWPAFRTAVMNQKSFADQKIILAK